MLTFARLLMISLFGLATLISCLVQAEMSQNPPLKLVAVNQLPQEQHSLVILDARPKVGWAQGHIPGALSFSWEEFTREIDQVPYRLPPVPELTAALTDLGIDETTPLLIYGDADSSYGGEGWLAWLFSYLGHRGTVSLLDGGIQSWLKAGRSLSKKDRDPAISVHSYRPNLQPELLATTTDIRRRSDPLQLVDVRSFFERLRGTIPGAVAIPWQKFYQGDEHRPLKQDQLIDLLSSRGLDPQKPIVYFCTGGIRSGFAWTVHQLAGLPTASNYEGGMAAWQKP